MKIFNWVHRKFNHKDGLAEINAKKSGVDVAENINQFEIESAFSSYNVFDGWKGGGGGILSIGTFGYDPLLKDDNIEESHVLTSFYESSEKEQLPSSSLLLDDDQFDYENSCDDDHITSDSEDDEEEVTPLMVYAAYNNNVHDDYQGLMETLIINPPTSHVISPKDDHHKYTKKQRTTLAELFYADSEQEKQLTTTTSQIIKDKKSLSSSSSSSNYKHGLSFAKKLLLNGDDAARPIHKLHRLIGRMLKRKIHPDVREVGLDNNISTITTTKLDLLETDCEFASLLSTHQEEKKMSQAVAGSSSSMIPFFDGDEYQYWKIKMRHFLRLNDYGLQSRRASMSLKVKPE
ncbi:hypothetical protein Salat_2260700 [Sesamum alatum]|uniref:Protein TILLER ANGLE CONTROL 1 n=1 Tax=Sesamum alatum TaxID=300844 RepID=A0AAE1XUW9_9LAMI|nr:hypothetical protein Salat_2260700 [Sesamum alatum]